MSLPNGWAKARLADVVSVVRKRVDPKDDPDKPYIGMDNVEAHTCTILGTVPAGTMRSAATSFVPGDVLYGRLRPYLNKVVAPAFAGLASAEFIPLTPAGDVSSDFIRLRLNAADFVTFTSHLDEGDRPRVDWDGISRFELALPPSAEQREIVEVTEAHLSRLDAANASLARVRARLRAYRASTLKAAVEGRLVPTEAYLSKKEKREYEPASVLLDRILKERRRGWEEAELARLRTAGKAPKDERWKLKYQEPEAPDARELPDLPEGWCWARLPQLGDLTRGKSKHRPRNDPKLLGGPYPFVQTGDVRKADTWLREFSETYSEFGLAQSRLWPEGTLCITIAANIAETAILTFDACFPDSVVGFLSTDATLARYIELFFRTARQRLEQYAPATAQRNINLETLSNVSVPLPPAAEQARIVEHSDCLLSIAASCERSIAAGHVRVGRLRQSVLKWAYEGKLVDQDSSDEPAEKLLARIRAERASITSTNMPRNGKGRLAR